MKRGKNLRFYVVNRKVKTCYSCFSSKLIEKVAIMSQGARETIVNERVVR